MMFSDIIHSIGVVAGCVLVGYVAPVHFTIPDAEYKYALGRLRTAEAFTADIVKDRRTVGGLWDRRDPVCSGCDDEYEGICVHINYLHDPPPRRDFTERDAYYYCQITETQRRLNKIAGLFGLTYPVTGAFTKYTHNLNFVELEQGPPEYDRHYERDWISVYNQEMAKVTDDPPPYGTFYFAKP